MLPTTVLFAIRTITFILTLSENLTMNVGHREVQQNFGSDEEAKVVYWQAALTLELCRPHERECTRLLAMCYAQHKDALIQYYKGVRTSQRGFQNRCRRQMTVCKLWLKYGEASEKMIVEVPAGCLNMERLNVSR